MKNIETLTRGNIVTLTRDCSPMSGEVFHAGDSMKFLGWHGGVGNICRLSRVGDNAKLMVIPADVGYGFEIHASSVETVKQVEPSIYDEPHMDESGPSSRIVIATVLAGKDSGEVCMHLTPAEEREYNSGMALLSQW